MDASHLVACFDASFSPNANVRIASELELRKLERLEGMPSAVLQIIAAPETSPPVRQAAAVYLKNRIARNWSGPSKLPDSPTSAAPSSLVPISDSDRSALKDNILHVLVNVPQQNVKVQLKTCLATMTGEDFPEKWQDLTEKVLAMLQSGQENQIEGALLTLIEVLKVYRYRRFEREVPNKICEQTMPLLVRLGQHLLAASSAPSAPESTGHLLHLIAKAYKISIVGDMSPHQMSQESIVQWGTFLLQIVCRVIPEDAQPQDKDDREKWSWWKAKKWAHHVLNRLYNTYGSPSQLPSNKSNFKAFAENFETHFAPEILKAYIRCVETYVDGQVWMSRRCCRFVLEFFEDCVKPKAMWQLLKPNLDLLISRFVFPCICLTDEELEQFDEDPVEYSRAHFGEFIEDWFSSPITAALSFLQVLTKARKKTTFMPMLNTVNDIVSHYPAERTAKEKDGALRMLSCLAETVIKTKGVGDQMQEFFVSYVFPEFTSKIGHLRVRALDMVEKFEEVDMSWPDSNRLLELFNMVITCMTDEALPVRVQAALALPELVRYDEVRSLVAANVGRLMQELLKLQEETDIDALSKPTRALVTGFPEELLPFATDISTQMRDSFLRLMNEIIELQGKNDPSDLLSGGGDDIFAGGSEIDEKTLVAMNVLQTLETLLRSVSTAPPIVAQIETILLPVLSACIQHEIVELFDEVFELAHSITYYQRSISPNMWQIFEQLHALAKGSGIDFIEELNNVFDNYVTYGGPFLAGHEAYKAMFLDIFEVTMKSESLGAQDRVSACKLAGQTLLCLKGSMDQHLERYIPIAMSFILRKDSREEPIVTNELHANALELVVTALFYNSHLTVAILSKHNHAEEFFKYWFKATASFTRVHDRKIGILAVTSLLTSMPNELAGMPNLPEQLMKAALVFFDGLPKALKARKETEDNFGNEDEDDDEDIDSDDGIEDGFEDDADVHDEDNDYQEFLAAKQKEMASLATKTDLNGAGDDDDEEGDDEYEDEEGIFGAEQLFETPLDKFDTYVLFSQAIHGLQQTHQALFERLTSPLAAEQQQALHAIVAKAQTGGEELKSGPQPL